MSRDWAEAKYIRIYSTIPDDPKTKEMWDDDAELAWYVRLLMTADMMWPVSAPLPRAIPQGVLDRLVDRGNVRLIGAASYTITGLEAERRGRKSGRAAGGHAREETAERDPNGRFLPDQRPPAGAGADAGVAGDAGGDAGAPLDQQMLVPASQQPEDEDEQEDSPRENPHKGSTRGSTPRATTPRSRSRNGSSEPADVQALLDRGWKRVTVKQREMLYEIRDRHNGTDFAVTTIEHAGASDPLRAVLDADRIWQDAQRRRIAVDEAASKEHGPPSDAVRDRLAALPTVKAVAPTKPAHQPSDGPAMDQPRKSRRNGVDPADGRDLVPAFTLPVPTEGPCRDCGGPVTDKDPSRAGPGWIEHAAHPVQAVAT